MSTLEEKQKACTEMLLDFHVFCEQHNITYFLSFGSALGAIRHKGFIPWDDDVDVDMHVDDIVKLEEKWHAFGNKDMYFLQTKKTDINVPEVFIRIRKNNTTALDEKYMHVPMHWGLSLDIFPVYNCPETKMNQKKLNWLYILARYTSYFPYKFYNTPKVLHQIATFICISALRKMKKISDNNSGSVYLFYPSSEGNTKIIPREVYFPRRKLSFGAYEFWGMNKVEKYLELQYGDYMTPPPIDQRGGHGSIVDLERDYSFYIKEQKKRS